MERIALDLGFIQIYWYSIFILLGILCGSFLIFTEAKKKKLNQDYLTNLIFYGIIFALIGARLYYCLFRWEEYSSNLIEVFEIWEGGLAIHGGLIFGGLWILFYTLKYKINTFKTLDLLVPGVILGQAIGRWGNFFNKEAFGKLIVSDNPLSNYPSFIKNGMYITENVDIPGYYEPTFLYESIWNFIGLIIILIIRKVNKNLKNGQLTCIYLMWYSFGRFFIESRRSDSLMLGNFKMAQIISVLLLTTGFIIYLLLNIGPKFVNNYNEDFKEIKF